MSAKLIVYNTETGKSIAGFDSAGAVDDVFYDAAHKLIFVIREKDISKHSLNKTPIITGAWVGSRLRKVPALVFGRPNGIVYMLPYRTKEYKKQKYKFISYNSEQRKIRLEVEAM